MNFSILIGILFFIIKLNSITGQSPIQIPPKAISEPWNYGSTCVDMNNYTDSEMANVCRDYLSPYYNLTYADFMTPARLAILQAAAQVFFLFPEQCGVAAVRWICATQFPECIPNVPVSGTNGTLTVNMQKYACRTLCQDVHDLCYDSYINIIGATPEEAAVQLTCDPPGLAYFFGNTNRTIFPNATNANRTYLMEDIPHPLNYTDPNLYWNTTSTCFDANRFLVVGDIPFTCPSQYGFTEGGGFCTFECPYPIINLDQYVFLWAWTGSWAFISMISCLIVLSIYTCFPYFRHTTIMEIYNILIAAIIYSFAFVMALPIGYKEMWCDGDDPNLWGHPGCTIQGILITYSLWVIVLWWFTLILELVGVFTVSSCTKRNYSVLQIHRWKRIKLFDSPEYRPIFKSIWRKLVSICRRREYISPDPLPSFPVYFKPTVLAIILLVWGVAAIPVLIGLASQHLGFSGGDAWCTFHANEKVTFKRSPSGVVRDGGGDPDGWNLGLLTVPLALIVLVGSVLVMIMMIGYLFKLGKNDLDRIKEKEGISRKAFCLKLIGEQFRNIYSQTKDQKRLIFYVIVMVMIFTINLIFRIVFTFEKPEMIDELGNTMTCYFNQISGTYVQIPGTITDETISKLCDPDEKISYWFWAINCTITGMTGLFISCIFGCNRLIPKHIYWALTCKGKSLETDITQSDFSGEGKEMPVTGSKRLDRKARRKTLALGGSSSAHDKTMNESSSGSNDYQDDLKESSSDSSGSSSDLENGNQRSSSSPSVGSSSHIDENSSDSENEINLNVIDNKDVSDLST